MLNCLQCRPLSTSTSCRVEDYQSLCDVARCGRELWGLETVVMTHGPRANPGQIEDMAPLLADEQKFQIGHGQVGTDEEEGCLT